jgi:hypothetical protein
MIKMMTQEECQLVQEPFLDMLETFVGYDVIESQPNFWEGTIVKDTSSENEKVCEKITIKDTNNMGFLIHNTIHHILDSGFVSHTKYDSGVDNPVNLELSDSENGIGLWAVKNSENRVFHLYLSQTNKKILIELSKNEGEWMFSKTFELFEIVNALKYVKEIVDFGNQYVEE